MSVLELNTKDGKIMYEIYMKLFAAATPPADFEELCANAIINEKGQREIPFMDYEMSQNDMDNIIMNVLKKHKVPKHKITAYKMGIYLGCSPRTKLDAIA